MVDQVELRSERLDTVAAGCDALFSVLDSAHGERYAESVEELEGRHDVLVSAVRDLVCLLHDAVRAINATEPHPNNTGEV